MERVYWEEETTLFPYMDEKPHPQTCFSVASNDMLLDEFMSLEILITPFKNSTLPILRDMLPRSSFHFQRPIRCDVISINQNLIV